MDEKDAKLPVFLGKISVVLVMKKKIVLELKGPILYLH